jgi:uncharacterized membrane protein
MDAGDTGGTHRLNVLERATGLSRGNFSVHLTRLEEAGMIEIEKTIE